MRVSSPRSKVQGFRLLWLWLCVAVVLMFCGSGCVGGPSVTRTPKGGYHATTGYVLLAKRKGVVAEVITREGDHLKLMAEEENGVEAVLAWIGMRLGLGLDAGMTSRAAIAADERVAIGAQGVQMHAAEQATETTLGTFVKPEGMQ